MTLQLIINPRVNTFFLICFSFYFVQHIMNQSVHAQGCRL